jgi:hypothetical protein
MTRLLLVLACLLSAAVLACGGGDDAPDQTLGAVTPVGTKDTTPTPPPDAGDGSGGPPVPVDPELDEELTLVTEGELDAVIDAGGSYDIDPTALASEAGAEPDCANLQFDFSWQVTDPYPPDGVALVWQLDREGNLVQVASGAAGNQAVPCGALNAVNQGAGPITVAIKYLIGALQ